MTKKLEELFNLQDTIIEPEIVEIKSVAEREAAITNMSIALPTISELQELGEEELDILSDKALAAHDNLMDLAMNVEIRYASRLFEVASSMMGNAITAKNSKLDKKLKAIDLQMKKMKIDQSIAPAENNTIAGSGYIIADRNELLKTLSEKGK